MNGDILVLFSALKNTQHVSYVISFVCAVVSCLYPGYLFPSTELGFQCETLTNYYQHGKAPWVKFRILRRSEIYLAFCNGCLWENIFLSISKEYICRKNNFAQLYFIWGRFDLCCRFSVYLRMDLIFTDFPTGSESHACTVLEICKYQRHTTWKIPLFIYASKAR